MPILSSSLPWLFELDDEETKTFINEIIAALNSATTAEIGARTDEVMEHWRTHAINKRRHAEQEARLALEREARDLKNKLKLADEQVERRDLRVEQLTAELRRYEDELDCIRSLMQQASKGCYDVATSDLAKHVPPKRKERW
jgi:chromosome segregation ATPase